MRCDTAPPQAGGRGETIGPRLHWWILTVNISNDVLINYSTLNSQVQVVSTTISGRQQQLITIPRRAQSTEDSPAPIRVILMTREMRSFAGVLWPVLVLVHHYYSPTQRQRWTTTSERATSTRLCNAEMHFFVVVFFFFYAAEDWLLNCGCVDEQWRQFKLAN